MQEDAGHNAVADLGMNPKEAPESVKEFVEELTKYDSAGNMIDKSIKEAEHSIKELNIEMQRLYGSVNAVVNIIIRKLSDEQINQFSDKRKTLSEA